jgi:hypothetical protein
MKTKTYFYYTHRLVPGHVYRMQSVCAMGVKHDFWDKNILRWRNDSNAKVLTPSNWQRITKKRAKEILPQAFK